ncbi:MAG: ribosome-associated translation inhibitor RaiA [Syntrophaceae bacterium]
MQVSVTFRNTEAEDWFKDYANERLAKLRKFIDKPLEAHVIMTVEKFRNIAEVNLLAKGININGKEEAKDMQLAFDIVMDKIERQLVRHKEIVRNHKENSAKEAMNLSGLTVSREDTEQSGPAVVETRRVILQPMSVDDAIMELESSRDRFVLYRDSLTEKVMVLYRRDDGNYALIEAA